MESALLDHLNEIKGVPMSVEDVTVRFCIYAGLLLNPPYDFTEAELRKLIEVGRQMQFTVQTINRSNGN